MPNPTPNAKRDCSARPARARPVARRRGLLVAALATTLFWLLPAASARSQAAEETRPARKRLVVLVPPFENLSGARAMVAYEVSTGTSPDNPKRRFYVDRYSEAPRAILEDILVNIPGVSVVERQRLDALLLEGEFGSLSGLVDPAKAVKLGKMLGANAVIMGTIVQVGARTRNFHGYGVSTRNTAVTATLRIRVVNVESGRILCSKEVRGSASFLASQYGGLDNSDVAFTVIQDALEKLRGDADFRARLLGGGSGGAGRSVEVDFSPKPDNSDVEIDGQYVGGSPLKRSLVTGKEYKVRISKAGYEPWQATIAPQQGLRITHELEPLASHK
jgi:curli biogenesis system outer membrane secretion channel CsgG